MGTQIFEVTGTHKITGKPHRTIIKIGGGRMSEEEVEKHFKRVRHPLPKKLKGMKITYKGDEDMEALDESGKPVPPSPELLKALDAKTGRIKEPKDDEEEGSNPLKLPEEEAQAGEGSA